MKLERHVAAMYDNAGSRPGGVLKHEKTLSQEAAMRLKTAWRAHYGGANRGTVAVLEEGLEFYLVTIQPMGT